MWLGLAELRSLGKEAGRKKEVYGASCDHCRQYQHLEAGAAAWAAP